MKSPNMQVAVVVVCLILSAAAAAQAQEVAKQSAIAPVTASDARPAQPETIIPRLIKFSGTLLDAQERPMAGPVGVTFALYAKQSGGAALWLETQNVKPDANGNYTVLLGANSANGVPAELFVSGEARWLGIQVGQQPEHERILLVSVPYALKAGDAETLGGKPLSSFVLNDVPVTQGSAGPAATPAFSIARPAPQAQSSPKKSLSSPLLINPCSAVVSDGSATASSIAMFTAPCNIESSVISQLGGNVGIGTATPAVAVDVVGNNAGLRLSGTGTHQVTVTGATSGRLGQDANGFFFASDTKGSNVRFLTNNGTLNEWMRITSVGNVGIGTLTPASKLDITGNQNITGNLSLSGTLSLPLTASATTGVISVNGIPFLNTFGSFNTFLGLGAGNFTTTGSGNNALGTHVLASNTTGSQNTALGESALKSNTTGNENTAVGAAALAANAIGIGNTAVGNGALLFSTGSSNIGIGAFAGQAATTGSNDIYIGSAGVAAEGNTIRIGEPPSQTATFVAGIRGITTGQSNAVAVLIDSNGQLGTTSSSRRFKYDIQDMGQASGDLLRLRPVAFRYKQAQTDGSHPLQYGLIAEEVAQVFPELVAYGRDGQPETVLYHILPAMLLNELQKQQRKIEVLTAEIRELRKGQRTMALLQARLARLEAQQKRAQTAAPEKVRDRNNGSSATQGR